MLPPGLSQAWRKHKYILTASEYGMFGQLVSPGIRVGNSENGLQDGDKVTAEFQFWILYIYIYIYMDLDME